MNNKKKIIIIAISISISLVSITMLGLTYARYVKNLFGTNNNKVVAGDIYMRYNTGTIKNITMQPSDTYIEGDYYEFTVEGKNESDKNIIYDVVLNHGENLASPKIRLADKFLRFRLVTVSNNVETEVVPQIGFDNINNTKIYVQNIPANTNSYNVTYRLYIWVNGMIVGNVDQDYTESDWANVYANIDVSVSGDFVAKTSVKTLKEEIVDKSASVDYIKNYRTEVIENSTSPNPTFTTQDTYDTNNNKQDIYYYTTETAKANNNVLFAGYCWQIIRTTDTGGVKLLYNGVAENDKCLTLRNSGGTLKGINGTQSQSITGMNTTTTYGTGFTYTSSGFTLTGIQTNRTWSQDLVGMYTCKGTATTCATIYQLGRFVNSTTAAGAYYTIGNLEDKYTIGKTPFNGAYNSPNYVGYMYNDNVYLMTSGTLTGIYGNDVEYQNNAYTLLTTTTSQANFDKDHHYICNDANCTQVRYYYRKYTSNNVDTYYYILLSNGKKIEDVLYETLNYKQNQNDADIDLNTRNSSIKACLESWYSQNLNSYANYIDDTATFCNDRTITGLGSFAKNSSNITSVMTFKNYNSGSKDLRCENIQDRFSVKNNKAKLTYPIGLITENERALMGAAAGDGVTDKYYWGSSPYSVARNYAVVRLVAASGDSSYNDVGGASGARPAVSLRPATSISEGDGSYESPYVVGEKITRTIS